MDRLDPHLLHSVDQFWVIDVLQHRELSNFISKSLSIRHESPQALILYKGECIWEEDHMDIHPTDIAEVLIRYREKD